MSSLKTTAFMFLLALLVLGCSSNDEESKPGTWQVNQLWPRGTRPVSSPTSTDILFTQEEAPAGLYLLRDGIAEHLNPTGPAAQADYAWSKDGRRFCFSGPGQPGDPDAGIFVAWRSSPTQFARIWDRGSHPRFLNDGLSLVCAGPEDGSNEEGIWYITVANQARERLADRGLSPEVSPDGLKIAYMISSIFLGSSLVTANLETGERVTLADNALTYSWLGDSRSLVFETLVDDTYLHISVMTVSPRDSIPVAVGTLPSGFPEGTDFVYTGLDGARLAGLWIAGANHPGVQISTVGTRAAPSNRNRIVAQDTTGIIEITR